MKLSFLNLSRVNLLPKFNKGSPKKLSVYTINLCMFNTGSYLWAGMVVTVNTLSLSCSICTRVGPVAAVFVFCKQLSLLSFIVAVLCYVIAVWFSSLSFLRLIATNIKSWTCSAETKMLLNMHVRRSPGSGMRWWIFLHWFEVAVRVTAGSDELVRTLLTRLGTVNFLLWQWFPPLWVPTPEKNRAGVHNHPL